MKYQILHENTFHQSRLGPSMGTIGVNIVTLILLMLIMIPISAFEIRDGDSIVISSPVPDDLLISGGTATINAPVKSVTFAGGTLTVNAPVKENLIGAGGEIQVNAPVGTDVIAAGGRIHINNEVGGKVFAAGGEVTMNGIASNVALYGDKVTLGKNSHITGDVCIRGSDYTLGGQVDGKVKTDGEKGGFGPSFDLKKIGDAISAVFMIIQILFAIGMLILGIILIRLIPGPCNATITTLREKTLMSLVLGIAGSIIAFILTLILVITLVGIPIAIFITLITLIGLMTAILCTSAALGKIIAERMGRDSSLIISFVIGFIVLEFLFLIPILGFILKIIVVFIGLGALIMTTGEAIEAQT